jgi:c-di-AMP phosphodiesterase-like protein
MENGMTDEEKKVSDQTENNIEQAPAEKTKVKGFLKAYLQWPFAMASIMVLMNVVVYQYNPRIGKIVAIFVAIAVIISVVMYIYGKSRIIQDLIQFASQYGSIQESLLREINIPYAILMEDGRIAWTNDKFLEIIGHEGRLRGTNYLKTYFPEITRNDFPKETESTSVVEFTYEDKDFRARISLVSVENFSKNEKLLQLPTDREYFIAVYLEDITELSRSLKENEEARMVAGLIYIDNYDEVIESVEDVRQSLLFALVDRKINQYVAKSDGIVKRMENDKYIVSFKKKDFSALEASRFAILNEVKEIKIGNNIPVTLSIGFGLSKDSYSQSNTYARTAIDQALARGGDQAVIKDCNGINYYGGKQEQTAKNTRVKARVKAQALQELITLKDRIFVMGHQMPDVDAFGAAIGIYRAAKELQKTVHIVLDEIPASLKPMYAFYKDNEDYPENLFISSDEAIDIAKPDSMVIVVDTSRPQMTECPELLDISETVVVFDHHRQSSDAIENAVLSYVETYASSTSEMVAEVLQYIAEGIKVPKLEATSLYAGIMIDTNNFLNRTGVRTFEAAAFLRRSGADLTMLRKLFRDDMDSYKAKAEIISSAENYRGIYAIAKGIDLRVESPTIIGAQASDELLDIDGVKASFVLTEFNEKIYVSARSIDEVNVQIIMEKLGGGGHMNAAGAQFVNTHMDSAILKLKRVIDELIQSNELEG